MFKFLKKLNRFYLLIAVLSAVMAGGLAHAHADLENKIFILMSDEGFVPEEAKIIKGGAVHFKNIGGENRWPASELHPVSQIYAEIDPLSAIPPGKTWKFETKKTGKWEITDKLNPKIKGTLEVLEEKNSSEIKKTGFFSRFFTPVKKFFLALKSYADQMLSLVLENSDEFSPDESIAKNSKAVFVNARALYSYVTKFGPAEALIMSEALPGNYERHLFSKKVGGFAYDIFGERAFQWHDASLSSETMGGYFLGVISAYAGKKKDITKLKEEFENITASVPVRAHTLGHSLMMWTGYELFEALDACEAAGGSAGLISDCWGGVFMENIVGSQSPETGHISSYVNNDPRYPCNVVKENRKSACYKFIPYRFAQIFKENFAKFAEECSALPPEAKPSCFAVMGTGAAKLHTAEKACDFAPAGEPRELCSFGAARAILWNAEEKDSALRFCGFLSEPAEKNSCFEALFARGKELFSSKEEYDSFCAAMPLNYQNACLNFTPSLNIFY